MIEDTSPQVLLSNQFASFEELGEKAVGWDFEFRQISKNYSVTTLDQILAGNLMYTHLTSGSFAIHDGAAPHDMFTVCIPDRGCPEFHYADKVIDQPVMICIDSDKEFHLAASVKAVRIGIIHIPVCRSRAVYTVQSLSSQYNIKLK